MKEAIQIILDNVTHITTSELKDLLNRIDNLNTKEAFMLGVNAGRAIEYAVEREDYTSDDVFKLHDFIEGFMNEKPLTENDLKETEENDNWRLTKYPL